MSLVSLFWPDTNANDIHLLTGLVSPRLDHLLFIEDTRGNVRADAPHPGVTVSFAAQFAGAPSNHGVAMNAATGEITVASPLPAPPAPRLRSFLVTCTATEAGVPQRTRIRVHVHERIARMRLTPTSLTVRQGAQGVRFTVLAQFDDGAIGDITNWSPFNAPAAADRTFVRSSGSTDPFLMWSTSAAATVDVDARTGVLDANVAAGSATIAVQHPPLPPPATAIASATARCGPAWSTPVRLSHVSGPGFGAVNDVHNILLLPDGFQDTLADRAAFERMVRGVASRLSVRQKTRPFDLFRDRLNYFMAWVASPDAGVSVLNELDQVNRSGANAEGVELELPSANRPGAGAWSLDELINEVGLPTPVNDPAGSPLGTTAAGRLAGWRTLYGPHVTAAAVTAAYPRWLDRNDRVVLNERDTAFHVAIGDRPRVDGTASERTASFDIRRMRDDDFDTFLDALTDNAGAAMPNVWSSGGKDDDLVVILCRSNRNAGSNAARGDGHTLGVSLRNDDIHRITANPAGNGFDVRPDPVPGEVHPDTWTTIAHELAHSWTLMDEYAGDGAYSATEIANLASQANVQPRAALLDGGGNLVTTNLKWRWPRIARAGVLTANPGPVGANFRLVLRAGHAGPFVVGDVVRLRTRPLLPAPTTSDRWRVSDRAGDELEIEPLPGSTLNAATFPAGSIVMVPQRAPDPSPGVLGADLELVAQSIRARIDATHNPLNAAPGDPVNRPCAGGSLPTPTPATNFPGGAAPRPPQFSSWIVGIHEEGGETDCTLVRPTGICLMRRLLFTQRAAGRIRAYQFCPVCKYAMVDLIDPSRHGAIDVDFAPRYPA